MGYFVGEKMMVNLIYNIKYEIFTQIDIKKISLFSVGDQQSISDTSWFEALYALQNHGDC